MHKNQELYKNGYVIIHTLAHPLDPKTNVYGKVSRFFDDTEVEVFLPEDVARRLKIRYCTLCKRGDVTTVDITDVPRNQLISIEESVIAVSDHAPQQSRLVRLL